MRVGFILVCCYIFLTVQFINISPLSCTTLNRENCFLGTGPTQQRPLKLLLSTAWSLLQLPDSHFD